LRRIRRSSRFKKDFKKAGKQKKDLKLLRLIIQKLIKQEQLDKKYGGHPLSGVLKGYRELHLEPDWLLIYKITEDEIRLARLGSHSELFD